MKPTLLQNWQDETWPVIRVSKPSATGEGVIDAGAFNSIEVDELFDTVNHAKTQIGQAVLYRSLTNPLDNAEAILAKQQAILEIQQNPAVRENLENIVNHAAETETQFYTLLFGQFLGSFGTSREIHQIEGYGYKQYRRGIRFMLNLVSAIHHSGTPQSAYLKSIFNQILNFSESRDYSLMVGPVYNSEQGLQSKEERVHSFTPAVIFRPSLFKPLLLTMLVAIIWGIVEFFPTDLFNFNKEIVPVTAIFFIPLLLIYFPVIGGYDRDNCIVPLRDTYRNSPAVAETLDALGKMDELLSLIKYAENYGSDTVLPTMHDAEHHSIELEQAKNPVLGFNNPAYVGNPLTLQDERLLFITGPNSGGKTAFCKTISQIQLLAQIGSFVPASKAVLAVADRIFYQAPEISHLDDGEGRFGTELKRTRDIFLATTPKSLVVLDEMAEGTTFEEKMESSTNVLDGFYRKGNNTILITHNHQLVDVFVKKRIGLTRQVEFDDHEPTFRLIPGISRVSHADRVAKKIGFSKEDIDHYLSQKS